MSYLENELLLEIYRQFQETGNREGHYNLKKNPKGISADDLRRALNILADRGSIEVIDSNPEQCRFKLTDKGIIHLKNDD